MLAIAGLGSAIGACSTDQINNITTANLLPNVVGDLTRPDWLSYSGGKEDFSLRPAGPNDLVGPEGQCTAPAAAAPMAPEGDPSGLPPGTPLVAGGIALQMTECDVVLRIGHPEQLEFSTNERGDRTVVITYLRGNRPGTYRFAGGRLYSIERPPGPPPTERQPKGKAKKARG